MNRRLRSLRNLEYSDSIKCILSNPSVFPIDLHHFENSGRYATHHSIGGHVLRHHCAGCDDSILAYRNALGDDRAGPDPDPVLDVDGCVMVVTVIGIKIMVHSGHDHTVPDQDIVPDIDPALVLEMQLLLV